MAEHESKTTTDHPTIKRWVEERSGRPARVRGAAAGDGILRIDFGEPEEELETISWEEFFKIFDERRLALLYQEENQSGGLSRFFKFVTRKE